MDKARLLHWSLKPKLSKMYLRGFGISAIQLPRKAMGGFLRIDCR